MNCRFFSVAIFLPLLVMADGSDPLSNRRELGVRMIECGLAWAYRYHGDTEHCSMFRHDAETRVGGQCKDQALEQARLYAIEAAKLLPVNKLGQVIDSKEEKIYAVADAPDPDAAIMDHIRELDCERWLNHSRMQ